jgi:hypothetical protein
VLGLVRAGIAGDRSSGGLLSASCNLQLSCAEDPRAAINTLLYPRIAYDEYDEHAERTYIAESTRVLTNRLVLPIIYYLCLQILTLNGVLVIVLAESRAVREWGLGHIGNGGRIPRFTRLSGPGQEFCQAREPPEREDFKNPRVLNGGHGGHGNHLN